MDKSHRGKFDRYESPYSWKPCVYKYPKVEDEYLVLRVFSNGNTKLDVCAWKNGKWYLSDGRPTYTVTHWKTIFDKPDDEYVVWRYGVYERC